VHLIRASLRYASYTDRKKLAQALRPIYTAPTADAAEQALLELADSPLGRKHRSAIAVWERAWDRFIPFLAFPPELRKVIYTTNTIESLNYQLRKIIKNRGHFPQRRRRGQAALAGHLRHRRQTRPRPRSRQRQTRQPTHRPRPTHRRLRHHRLETSPRRP